MLSTMMTVESTMMPKSTAPMDSRFADLPQEHDAFDHVVLIDPPLVVPSVPAAGGAEEPPVVQVFLPRREPAGQVGADGGPLRVGQGSPRAGVGRAALPGALLVAPPDE